MATSDINSPQTTIQLTRGISTTVDLVDADLDSLHWHVLSHGYAAHRTRRSDGHKVLLLHRVILERMLERKLVKGECVDHIDGNRLNNKRSNLRLASHQQNMRNCKIHSNNQSGYKGVWPRKDYWCASIRVNGKSVYLGAFASPEEAHQAYVAAARHYHGDFANSGD